MPKQIFVFSEASVSSKSKLTPSPYFADLVFTLNLKFFSVDSDFLGANPKNFEGEQ